MTESAHDRAAVLITGTSSGIGRATALLLDEAGYLVFAGVRKEADAESLRSQATSRLQCVILDICKPDHIQDAVRRIDEAISPGRGLTALINNAGIAEPGPLEYISMDRFRKQMEVNVTCHLEVIQAFMPLIRRGPGRIINVASAIARSPLPCFGAYVASKCAMEGLSDVLRRELSRWDIPVSVVEPGTVEAAIWDNTPSTPDALPEARLRPELIEMYRELNQEMYDMMQRGRKVAAKPVSVARVIKKAIESKRPRARYQTGPGAKMAVLGSRTPEFITDWIIDNVVRKRFPTKLIGW